MYECGPPWALSAAVFALGLISLMLLFVCLTLRRQRDVWRRRYYDPRINRPKCPWPRNDF